MATATGLEVNQLAHSLRLRDKTLSFDEAKVKAGEQLKLKAAVDGRGGVGTTVLKGLLGKKLGTAAAKLGNEKKKKEAAEKLAADKDSEVSVSDPLESMTIDIMRKRNLSYEDSKKKAKEVMKAQDTLEGGGHPVKSMLLKGLLGEKMGAALAKRLVPEKDIAEASDVLMKHADLKGVEKEKRMKRGRTSGTGSGAAESLIIKKLGVIGADVKEIKEGKEEKSPHHEAVKEAVKNFAPSGTPPEKIKEAIEKGQGPSEEIAIKNALAHLGIGKAVPIAQQAVPAAVDVAKGDVAQEGCTGGCGCCQG